MEDKKGNISQILVVLLIILNFLVIGAFGFWFYSEKIAKLQPSPSPSVTPETTPEATATPETNVTPTSEPTSSPQTKTDLELIKETFAEKYNKPIGDVTVTISKQANPYASGGVKFAGEMGGAMWLAYNDGVRWIIIYDGHGTIPCEAIEPYDFPVDMVPECFRESDGTLIHRS